MDQLINTFKNLVETIQRTNQALQNQAARAVNLALTFRNWLVGFYIVEFEQNGDDRAKYGESLISNLAGQIRIKGLTASELSRCRQFYRVYPEIFGSLTQKFISELNHQKSNALRTIQIFGLPTQKSDFIETTGASVEDIKLVNSISYTHFVELIKIEDLVKRRFYEMLILKTQPNVKELKRQIATLSYERLGISVNKEKALEQIAQKIRPSNARDAVKTHYFFEFLGLNAPELIEESELEQALIKHLQQFIIELGNGFCFEARQKRLLIGDEYFFVDLVFYHRVLKCHVLIELKVDSFNHGHASQLVTYLNYYRQNLMEETDNPPIGILLVTDKNTALVEYAAANEKDRLFVSKYKLQLPSEQELKTFIENELQKEIEE